MHYCGGQEGSEKCGGVSVEMTDAQALERLRGHWQEGRGTEARDTASLEGNPTWLAVQLDTQVRPSPPR